jgi:transcriptional regulator with XRE-family HTH domain
VSADQLPADVAKLTTLGERVRAFRTKNGLSQTQLAEAMGSKNYPRIGDIEANRLIPKIDELTTLAEALGIGPGPLTDGLLDAQTVIMADRQALANQLLIGRTLRAVREIREYGMTYAAELIGISPSFLLRIESGQRKLGQDTLLEIANAYAVTIDGIFNGSAVDEAKAESDMHSAIWKRELQQVRTMLQFLPPGATIELMWGVTFPNREKIEGRISYPANPE